jgi:hypothetical protein
MGHDPEIQNARTLTRRCVERVFTETQKRELGQYTSTHTCVEAHAMCTEAIHDRRLQLDREILPVIHGSLITRLLQLALDG